MMFRDMMKCVSGVCCAAVMMCASGAWGMMCMKSGSCDITSEEAISCIADVKTGFALYSTLSNDKNLSSESVYAELEKYGVTSADLLAYFCELNERSRSNIFTNSAGRVLRISFGLISISKNDFLLKVVHDLVGTDVDFSDTFTYEIQELKAHKVLRNCAVCTLLMDMVKDMVASNEASFLDKYVRLDGSSILNPLVNAEVSDVLSEWNYYAKRCIEHEIDAN
jgi:hypothetical protein